MTNILLDGEIAWRDNSRVETRCTQCGAEMSCKPEGGCWCAELPHLPLPDDLAAKGCLCRACLLEKVKAEGAPANRPLRAGD